MLVDKGIDLSTILKEGGLLNQMTKRLVERALQSEMSDHLGYNKYESGYPMNIDARSATPHDSNCAKQVLFGLKEKFPRLIKVLADRGYQVDLQQWFYCHTRACLLSIVKAADGYQGVPSSTMEMGCRALICLVW